jgi:hypothetical protein
MVVRNVDALLPYYLGHFPDDLDLDTLMHIVNYWRFVEQALLFYRGAENTTPILRLLRRKTK